MRSVWNSVISLVFLCLFSCGATAHSSPKVIQDDQNTTRKEGSHVTINCKYKFQDNMQLLWFKDPKWNDKEKRYDGIIVYSNTEERPQVSEYSDRVEFFNGRIFDTVWRECALKINYLTKNDSGEYAFRFKGNDEKYMGNTFELKITDNPCNIHIKPQILNTLKEGDAINLSCTTSVACETHPKWQWSDSSEDLNTEQREDEVEKYSELKYSVSWTDDGRTLTCRPFGCSGDDCVESSVTLRIKYAPLSVNISPKLTILTEGDHLILICTVQNNNPAVEMQSYRWYKDGQEIDQQTGNTFTLPSVTRLDKGRYQCQARNSVGETMSTHTAQVYVECKCDI